MKERESTPAVTRRQALKAGVGAAATLGVAGAGTASAQSDAYGGYLSDAEWDGTTVDASGMDEIVVDVGAGPQGLQFDPPALYVEPGTTIVWTWTGAGGSHNVVGEQGPIDSKEVSDSSLVGEAGFTYEFTPEEGEAGAHQYYCVPHKALGMKGVLVVGEDNVETELTSLGGGGDSGLNFGPAAAGAAVFSAISLVGVAAYSEVVGDSNE
ncbi:halocyanin domain-containing protein [Halovenus rubra]|uniref:Halocyanin domain-containing protein n=2 Tax=Halovenus rubra TaxID=869890 RepID=A0ACC7E482_9EURY|nr:halocyanin domain-containing protein [Halovenus rubra]